MQFYQKLKIVVFVSLLLILPLNSLAADFNQIKITFISNSGFMLSSGDKTVIIDALHTPGYYLSSEEELANNDKLINLEEPFTKVDLILVTHSHPDHFHPGSSTAHLVNNPTGNLVANELAMSYIEYDTLYNQIQTQLISVNPDSNTYDSLNVNGISVLVYPIRHLERFGYSYPHLTYVINLNGITIYFGGDNIVEGSEFSFFRIDQKEIDFAFIRFWDFFKDDNIETFNNYINPKVLIPMHFLYGDSTYENIIQVEDSISKFKDVIPETHIFKDYLESKIYYFVDDNFIGQEGELNYNLYQNYPNPFNSRTRISFILQKQDLVEISIFDIQGKKVEKLVSKIFPKGYNYVDWEPGNLSGGVYFYSIKAERFSKTKKCLLIK